MKKILLYLLLLFITFVIIINPARTIQYALDGLGICYEVIIPSLFPFFVCSGLLVYSGFSKELSKLMRPFMKPLFNINGSGAIAFVLGIISGYPLGALTACQLYEGSYLSKTETERLLSFCNNSGPLFILGSVGIAMYHSISLGVLLYISHILAAISVGVIMRFYKKESYSPPFSPVTSEERSIGEIFSLVLSNSINSILTVCGSVIFMSVLSKSILEFVPARGIIHSFILGMMEFVSGMSELSGENINTLLKLLLSSWIVGFAGLSVHLQVMAIVSKYKLSLKPYIFGKFLHASISLIYTFILYNVFSQSLPAFSGVGLDYIFFTSSLYTTIAAVAIIGISLGVSFLLFLKESDRMKKRMKP